MNQDGTGFIVADKDFKGSTKNELVFVENSPDYCLMDRAAGETHKNIFIYLFIIYNLYKNKTPCFILCTSTVLSQNSFD